MSDTALTAPAVERRARKRRRGGRWLFAALVLAGLSVAAWILAFQADNDADRGAAEVGELDLLETRISMTRPALDEVTVRMLEPFGVTTTDDIEAAVAEREAATEAGRAALTAIAEADGTAASHAQRMLDVLDRDPLGSSLESLYQVTEIASIAQFEAAPPLLSSPNEHDSLRELAYLDQALLFGLHEVLTADWTLTELDADPLIADFFDDYAPSVEDVGGYLGPDPERPLVDGWIEIDTARMHYADVVDQLDRITADSGLWVSDQWVRGWAEGPLGPVPHDVDTLASDVLAAIDEARSVIDAPIATERETLGAVGPDSNQRGTFAKASGLVLALVAGAVALLGVEAIRTNTFHLRNRANTDALTGVGNRNMLDDEIAHRLGDDRFTDHALVMIDMDRFKVVNDTHGHATGDQLLREVATGLEAIGRSDVAKTGTVVRLGGDEFCLSLHHQKPIDISALREHLDHLRTSTIPANDGEVALDFSYGIALGNGTSELRDLMDAADLAAYEQKAERAAGFATQDHRTAPPVA